MFRWGRSRKKEEGKATAAPRQAGGADDWDFLRAQPDYDADEMQAVHSDGTDASPAASAPVGGNAQPAPESVPFDPALLDWPEPEEPRRRPRRVERSVAHPAGTAPVHNEGEHATKPLTLLSSLCARFQEPAEPRPEAERPYPSSPGWTLTLEISVRGRRQRRSVFGEAVIGRVDPDAGHQPEVDLSADDTVSRRHALIYERQGRFFLRDLDSMNGTQVNGEWLQPGGETPLEQGDEIQVGEFCRLQVVDPVMPPEDGLRDFLETALGGTLFADQQGTAPTPVLSSGGDVLDLALQRGQAVGLLWNPSGHEPN